MVAIIADPEQALGIFAPPASPPPKRLPQMRHTPPPTYAVPWTRRFPMFPGATPRRSRTVGSLSTPRMRTEMGSTFTPRALGATTSTSGGGRPSTTPLDPLEPPATNFSKRPFTSRSEWGSPAPADMDSSACRAHLVALRLAVCTRATHEHTATHRRNLCARLCSHGRLYGPSLPPRVCAVVTPSRFGAQFNSQRCSPQGYFFTAPVTKANASKPRTIPSKSQVVLKSIGPGPFTAAPQLSCGRQVNSVRRSYPTIHLHMTDPRWGAMERAMREAATPGPGQYNPN
jgi:hypothetical protein